MKNRKLNSIILALCLLLNMIPLAGLGTSASAAPSATAPGELPIVTEPTKLVIGTPAIATVTDYDDNAYTIRLRKDSGIDLEIFLFDAKEYKTQLQLMTTSGEKLPDSLWAFPLTDLERESYGVQGYFIPLNDYFDPDTGLTHFYDEACKYLTDAELAITLSAGLSSDGNLYAFPMWSVSIPDVWSWGLMINNGFLSALGMEVPTTTDELYDYLVAVRDKDPNGNGKADEIPYIGHIDWTGSVMVPIMNAFTFYPVDAPSRLAVTEAGELYLPFTLDAFRDGLAYLNKLYSEGLLSDLSFSQDRYALQAMTDLPAEEPDVVALAASHRSYMFASHGSAVKRMYYTTLGAIEGPEGVAYVGTYQPVPKYQSFITVDCEISDVAFRLMDYLTDAEITLCARYGTEGEYWHWATDEEKARGSAWEALGITEVLYRSGPGLAWGQQTNEIWNTTAVTWQPPLFTGLTPKADPNDPNTTEISFYNSNDWNGGIMKRYGKAPEKLVGPLAYTADEIAALGTVKTDLETYVDECVTRFILGEMNLEGDWNSYLTTLESIGMQNYLALSQAAYDRAYK